MPILNIPNLTRIHPLIILPGIGVASYFAVGFFIGPATAAKTPQQVAADTPVSGRSSARTSDGIPDQMPKTLWSSPAAAAVAPVAPVAVMGGSGGAASGAGGGASTSASSGHSHEANTGHMPPPHASVTPHNFYHPAAPPAPHVMQHAAPPPQMAQHFAPAPAPVYRPAPAPFFGGLFRGLGGGGGHMGGGFSGGGHHR